MKEDAEETVVVFNNIAAKVFSNISDQFLTSVQKLDRKRDENVFQMQAAKFSNALKSTLEYQAKKSFENYSGKKPLELQTSLLESINYFIREFQRKCREW